LKPWEKFLHVLFAPTASDRKFEEITQLGTKSKIEKAKLEQELTELQSQEAALRKQEADIRKQLDTIGQKIDEKKKLLMNP
jgi:phage shock protein A